MSKNASFKNILNECKYIPSDKNKDINYLSKNEPTTPLISSQISSKRKVSKRAATTTRKKSLGALEKGTLAVATHVTVITDNIQTTARKNSRSREPPPTQLRIDTFFKSCTKSYKIEPLSVKEEKLYSTAQSRKTAKTNTKSSTRRGSRARGAKGRKRLFKENDDCSTATKSSLSGFSDMASTSKKSNLKRSSTAKTGSRPVKRSKGKNNLQAIEDPINLCSSAEEEEEKGETTPRIVSNNLSDYSLEDDNNNKHVTIEAPPMVTIPVNQKTNDKAEEKVKYTKQIVKYSGAAISPSCLKFKTEGEDHTPNGNQNNIVVKEETSEQVSSKNPEKNTSAQKDVDKIKDEKVNVNTPPTPPQTNYDAVSNRCESKDSSKASPVELPSTSKGGRVKKMRICPPYKKVAGTTFAVDAFQYGEISGVTHYFLTHFHADHYQGLTRKFAMPIYVSPITARLVRAFIPVGEEYLHEIELNSPHIIADVEVTAIDANHCPGAVMFVFKLTTGRCILHTGDFRASSDMESEPIFWNNNIDAIYLDTTYISHKNNFSTQYESITRAKDIIKDFRSKRPAERVLYICGSYVIGKERFWTSIAQEFDLKVWTEKHRLKALQAMDLEEVRGLLCDDPMEAQLHVISIGKVSYHSLVEYFQPFKTQFDAVLAFRPSGWEKNTKSQLRGQINVVGIEYSEHSSHAELERFVTYLKPHEVISTVPVIQGNPCITPKIPEKWYKYRNLKSRHRNFQPSITSFIKFCPRQLNCNRNTLSKSTTMCITPTKSPEGMANNLSQLSVCAMATCREVRNQDVSAAKAMNDLPAIFTLYPDKDAFDDWLS
ncbi:uncharacterized protein LOC101454502 [Ceratitis capitata]|uniref:DNA cross-link repair 1A protein n=2 Tax=Ceratitis capitata TaxID=7213 RepID=W8BGM0_CERCA|nr:uncharacterized protein LOC101454502 [Ceratitis capitata]